MGLFSSTKSYLGIDLGSASIKVVELKSERGRPRLVTYGSYERPLGEVSGSLKEQPAKTAQILKKIMKEAKVTSKKAVAAMPTFTVFSSIISLPKLPPKDLEKAVRIEAKKVVPLPLEEMILDWKILETDKEEKKKANQEAAKDQNKKPAGKMSAETTEDSLPEIMSELGAKGLIVKKGTPFVKILLMAASKKQVQNTMEIFKQAGLTLLSLETEAFSLTRSLIGNDKSIIMIADFGSTNTDITVIDHGIPVLNRSINIGGLTLTKAIHDRLGITMEEAEQMKHDVGLQFVGEGQKLPDYIQESLSPVVQELRYSMDQFYEQCQKGQAAITRPNGDCHVQKLILTGGSAVLPGFVDYVSKQLDVNAYVGDPWARVIYPDELQPVLNEVGSKYNVALGLAMREIVK